MEEDKRVLFEETPIPKAVCTLTLPTTIGMLVMVLYNLVDTYFIGQTNDSVQVAAVSLAMPFFLVLMACGNLFGIGASSTISRYLGAGLHERVKNICSYAFYSATFLGIFMALGTLYYIDSVVTMTGADTLSGPYVRGYLITIAYGAPMIILSTTLSYLIRSEGHAKISMIGMVIGTITNIILDPIFIFTLDYGVVGAAIATVFGNLLAVIYYVVMILKLKGSYLSLNPLHFKLDHTIAKDVLSIGVPSSLNNLLMSISTIIYNAVLAKYGTDPVAAMGVVIKIGMIYMMLFMGLSTGVQPLLGYNYGAKNYKRLKKGFSFSLKLAFVIGTTCFISFYLAAEGMITFFIDDPEVIDYGVEMLRVQVRTAPLLGVIYLVTNLMQVANNGKLALFLSICRQGFTFIPAIFILDGVFGFHGLIWAQPVSDTVTVGLAVVVCGLFFQKLGVGSEHHFPHHDKDHAKEKTKKTEPEESKT